MGARLSFRARIVLLMLATTLLVMFIAGGVLDRIVQQTLVAESERYAQLIAAKTADEVEAQFDRVAIFPQTLSVLAETLGTSADARLAWYHATIPALFTAAPADVLSLTTFFEPNFIAGRQYAKVWYVRNPDGQVVPVTTNMPGEPGYDPKQPLYDYFQQEWYTAPITAQGLVWSEPYFDAGGANVNMVTASIPVRYQGKRVGVATADVEIDTINHFINTIRPTPQSYALLISRQGTFIVNPHQPETVLNTTISSSAERLQSEDLAQLGTAIFAQPSGFRHMRDPFTQVDVLAAYHTIAQTGWVMVIITPEADLMQPLNQLRSALLQIGVLTLICLAVIGWLAASTILRPFNLLYSGVQRFAADHSAVQLGITQGGEVGQLARAFEQMSAQIACAYTDLEQTVTARTADLQQALDARDQQARDLSYTLDQLQRKEQEVLALSVPIVPLLDDTLMVPMVGLLNRERALRLLHMLLQTVEAHRARVVIIDITGLAMLDEEIALLLPRAADALHLLGAEMILVGTRPEVAQTLVATGSSLDGMRTLSNLQAAVIDALKRTTR